MSKKRVLHIVMLSTLQALALRSFLYLGEIYQGTWFFASSQLMFSWAIFYLIEVLGFTLLLYHFFMKDPKRPIWNIPVQTGVFTASLLILLSGHVYNQEQNQLILQQMNLVQEKTLLLQKRFIRPVLQGEPREQNTAHILWEQLAARQQPPTWLQDSQQVNQLLQSTNEGLKQLKPQPQLVKLHQEQIRLSQRVIQSPNIPFSMKEVNYDSPLPNYLALQNHAKLMLNASSVKFGQAPQGSLEEMLDVVRFGQDIGHTGPLIQSLVGINIANEAAQVYTSQIEKIYQKNVETGLLLKQWEILLASHSGMIKTGLEAERLLTKMELYQQDMWDRSEEVSQETPLEHLILKSLLQLPAERQAFIKFTAPKLNQIYTYWLQNTDKNLPKALEASLDNNLFTRIFLLNLSGVQSREEESGHELVVAYVQTALADYYKRKGSYPQKLQNLDNLDWERWVKPVNLEYQKDISGYHFKFHSPKHVKPRVYSSPMLGSVSI